VNQFDIQTKDTSRLRRAYIGVARGVSEEVKTKGQAEGVTELRQGQEHAIHE
jgi:hypothetical protein